MSWFLALFITTLVRIKSQNSKKHTHPLTPATVSINGGTSTILVMNKVTRLEELKQILAEAGGTKKVYDELLRDYSLYGMDYATVSAQGLRITNGQNLLNLLSNDEAGRETARAHNVLLQLIDEAIKRLGGTVLPSSGHHMPATIGFNAADFIQALVRIEGDWANIQVLTFPKADLSMVQRFLDTINAQGPDSWAHAKLRGRYALLYGYLKTLFGLSQDADLFIDTIKPIEDLLVLRGLNRAPNFNADVLQIINKAEEHLRRIEQQEAKLRQQKATATETLRQTYNRLQGISVVGTKHDDWVALLQRVANENPSLAYRFTKLQADLEGLSNLTGRNLYDAIFSTGQPTISQRIAAAIKLVEDNAELI